VHVLVSTEHVSTAEGQSGGHMSTDDPSAREGEEPAIALGRLDDEGLLGALREMLGRYESPPSWSVELAKGSYDLRTVDAELAVLTSDSGLATAQSALRSSTATRLAVFDAADLSVEIEIEPGARADWWRLIGQLTPAAPARIQVLQQQAEPVWVEADDRGRFTVDHIPGGPLSLVCIRDGMPAAVTEWIAIG
jgi:hypothetical protein